MKSKYWYERQFAEMQRRSFDEIDQEMETCLVAYYKKLFYEIKADMLTLIDEIKNGTKRASGEILATDFYQYQSYYDLLNKIQAELVHLGVKEKQVIEQGLIDMYNDSFKMTKRSINLMSGASDKDYDTNLISVNSDRVKQIISQAQCSDDKTQAQRVNVSQSQFVTALNNSLIDCAVRGKSSKEVATELNKVLGEELQKTQRLVRTELAHIQNVASIDSYADAGIQYYTVLTAGDGDVCPVCSSYAGKKFSINAPCVIPSHPNCRCSTLAIFGNNEG